MKITLGDKVQMDLDKAIESRILVQANSGGGKSYTIRRFIEQAFGKKQIIVLDPEGEFANMRSKFDFVYAGPGGDAPVESRSAALLARRLLELKASAIIDLYELPPQERKHFVRLFLESMVNAPKELWHDCFVILDEAHVFAPEKDQAESLGAVIDLASRGRKRGYCLIPATQRPAKLNKDVAAECNNKLIGRASLDIDRKRASEELGFTTREEILSLRDLEPGEFYAFGPAIGRDVVRTKIGEVEVKPPKRGAARGHVPAPSAKVRAILGKLSDLPQEAQKEAQTVAELKAEIVSLKRQKPPVEVVPAAMGVSQWRAYGRERGYWDYFENQMRDEFNKKMKPIRDVADKLHNLMQDSIEMSLHPLIISTPEIKPVPMPGRDGSHERTITLPPQIKSITVVEEGSITNPEQRVLDAIAWMNNVGVEQPVREIVAFLAGYAHLRSKGFTNPASSLRSKGLIDYPTPGTMTLTDAGSQLANHPDRIGTSEELHEVILEKLDNPKVRILKPLLAAYPNTMTSAELAAAANYAHERSKGYTNPRSALRSFGLIEYPSPGIIKASDILFI